AGAASTPPGQPPGAARPPGLTWEQVRNREGVPDDGRVPRDKFKGPPALFDRLDRNHDGFLSKEDFATPNTPPAPPTPEAPKKSSALPNNAAQPTGLLYFASYPLRDNPAPVNNPHLIGALFTIYWSDIEPRPGVFDWTDFDHRAARWTGAGKKIAVRIM